MIHNFNLALYLGLCCSIFSTVLLVILPNERVANWWFVIGQKVGIKVVNNVEVERWFYRPIWGCEKCFAGQLALWLYIRYHWRHYNLLCHLLTIGSAIIFTVIISFIINQIQRKNDAEN
jgi:hypothetical protein